MTRTPIDCLCDRCYSTLPIDNRTAAQVVGSTRTLGLRMSRIRQISPIWVQAFIATAPVARDILERPKRYYESLGLLPSALGLLPAAIKSGLNLPQEGFSGGHR